MLQRLCTNGIAGSAVNGPPPPLGAPSARVPPAKPAGEARPTVQAGAARNLHARARVVTDGMENAGAGGYSGQYGPQ